MNGPPGRERRPAANGATATNIPTSAHHNADTLENSARDYLPGPEDLPVDVDDLAAGYALFRAAVVLGGPDAFTSGWLALPSDDPRKWAGLVRAAWCWHAAELELAAPASQARLDALVEQEVARELKAAAVAVSGAANWSKLATDSRYAQAVRKRRSDALAPRPADYPGGPVPPWGPEAASSAA